MKKTIIVIAICGLLLTGLWAVSAAAANFGGTWKLDKGKSTLPERMANIEGMNWTITQDDKQFTLKPEVIGGGGRGGGGRGGLLNQPETYNLDGSETTSELSGRMTGKVTRTARWMDGGRMLELKSVINGDFNGNAFTSTTTRHLELAEDGKVLKVHQTSESPVGSQEATLVFTKE